MRAAHHIIVALDAPTAAEALALADQLSGKARWLKVGMTLFYAEGPSIVSELRERGFELFVDLKIHDIPHQARGAAAALARLGCGLLTVHAAGGGAMVEAAVLGAAEGAAQADLARPKVIAVTVLTSLDVHALANTGVSDSPGAQAARLASLASKAGADGVVCSPQEAAAMRSLLGVDALVVTPGVRPEWAGVDDQARVATPSAALARGASHLVIGRPITAAADPALAFERIVSEIEEVSP
jgi:orotidine-5'-phosphate decarboxylase